MTRSMNPFRAAIAGCAALMILPAATLGQTRTQWVAQFGAAGNAHDQFRDLAVSPAGDVCMTGMNALGAPGDIVTVCFDADGNLLWTAQFDGPATSQDVAQAIAVAGQDVVVVGRSQTLTSSSDYVTIKYDLATGSQQWVRYHNGPSGSIDEARDVVIDSAGAVFVTGMVWNTGNGSDVGTVKYDADGNEMWSAVYSGPGAPPFADDIGHALALDPAGDVIVTGESAGFNGIDDYITLKYDTADGTELWQARYNGIGMSDRALLIAVDDLGDAYVTGITYQTAEMFATIRYRGSDGAELWVNIDDPGIHDGVKGIIVSDSAVFITSVSDPDGDQSNNNNNVYTARYAMTDGVTEWNADHGENGFGDFDGGYALARDGQGNVFVSGRTSSFGAETDILLLRYDETTGDELERLTYSGPGSFDTALRALLSPTGSIVLGGITGTPNGDNDYIALSFAGPNHPPMGDIDGSGTVDAQDLAMLLGSWGPCDDCDEDLDQNNMVNSSDLAMLLGNWD